MAVVRKVVTVTGSGPATATTAVIGSAEGFSVADFDSMAVECAVQGGTGGTLDLYFQIMPYEGTVWTDYAHLAQLADAAAATRVRFTVARDGQALTITTVGTALTPALAANTVLGGDFGSRMRIVATAGVGTSAGTAQTFRFFGSRRG